MSEYLVTDAFQFRGGILRSGQTVELTDGQAADPFVARHVRRVEDTPEGRAAVAEARERAANAGAPLKGNRPAVSDARNVRRGASRAVAAGQGELI